MLSSSSSRGLRDVYREGNIRDGWIAASRLAALADLGIVVGGEGVRTGVEKKSVVIERAGVGVEVDVESDGGGIVD